MKAVLVGQQINFPCMSDFGYGEETYSFKGYSDGPDRTSISLDISRIGLGPMMIQADQFDWEYEIEITITAKPKPKGLIIKL